jgi:hypothetical protein
MASKALHAAWQRSTILWWWMDMHTDECSCPLHEELRRAYNAAVVASSAGH